jgi:transcriptional regulator with XRE-family HTH domain
MAEGFGQRLRSMRVARGLTLRGLARLAHIDSGHLSRVEAGARPVTNEIAAALDRALEADGALAGPLEDTASRTADQAARESQRLAAILSAEPAAEVVVDLAQETRAIAVDYLSGSPDTMLARAADSRREALATLRSSRIVRPADVADVTLYAGHLSGVLAYAALDLAKPVAAMTHADAAWWAADAAGSDQLRAWVRGTQSLIARFRGEFPRALAYAEDGLSYAHRGTSRARLLCGVAQCHANLGDAAAAREALDRAGGQVVGNGDEMPGLFTFVAAKRAYYGASARIWLPGDDDARRALDEADVALSTWQSGAPTERSNGDEALAHVYAAVAALRLGELELAIDKLEPILVLPQERRISWIRKRLTDVAAALGAPRYRTDPVANQVRDRLVAY